MAVRTLRWEETSIEHNVSQRTRGNTKRGALCISSFSLWLSSLPLPPRSSLSCAAVVSVSPWCYDWGVHMMLRLGGPHDATAGGSPWCYGWGFPGGGLLRTLWSGCLVMETIIITIILVNIEMTIIPTTILSLKTWWDIFSMIGKNTQNGQIYNFQITII